MLKFCKVSQNFCAEFNKEQPKFCKVSQPFHSQEWSISAAPQKNITSHSMENLAFHSLLRWKMIIPPTLTTSPMHFSLKGWENVRSKPMGVKGSTLCHLMFGVCFRRSCESSNGTRRTQRRCGRGTTRSGPGCGACTPASWRNSSPTTRSSSCPPRGRLSAPSGSPGGWWDLYFGVLWFVVCCGL